MIVTKVEMYKNNFYHYQEAMVVHQVLFVLQVARQVLLVLQLYHLDLSVVFHLVQQEPLVVRLLVCLELVLNIRSILLHKCFLYIVCNV